MCGNFKIIFPKRKHGPAAGKPFPQRTQKASQTFASLSVPWTRPVGHTPQSPRSAPSNGITHPDSPRRAPENTPVQRTRLRAHAAVCRSAPPNGATRQVLPRRARPNASVQRPSPGRAASQTSAGRSRRNNSNPFLTGFAGQKILLSPPVCGPRGPCMQRAASPKFGMGHPPGRQPDSLVRCPSQRRRNLGAHPKFQNSALPTVRGWGSTSRMLAMPVRYITIRSNPRPKPACLQEPNRRRSRYHQ